MKKVEIMTHLLAGMVSQADAILSAGGRLSEYVIGGHIQIASDYADAILQGAEKDLVVAVGKEERGRCLGLVNEMINRYAPPDVDGYIPMVSSREVIDELETLYKRIRDGK